MSNQKKELYEVNGSLYVTDPGGGNGVRLFDEEWAEYAESPDDGAGAVSEDNFGNILANNFSSYAFTQIDDFDFRMATLVTFFMTGNVSASTMKYGWVAPFDCYYTTCFTRVGTAPASQSILMDINLNGTTMFTTQASRVAIAAAATSGTEVAPPDVRYIEQGDLITFDLDQVGSGTTGANMAVTLVLDPWIVETL